MLVITLHNVYPDILGLRYILDAKTIVQLHHHGDHFPDLNYGFLNNSEVDTHLSDI